jgi:hypothetical protein
MEYIGVNTGPVPWTFDGVAYVGANDGTVASKYVQALPHHVDRLLQTGRWSVAQ